MNPLKFLCVVACLLALANASSANRKNKAGLKPTDWLSASQLEEIPAVSDLTLQRLEQMPLEQGAKLVERLYHLSQINNNLQPSYVPSPNNVPVNIYRPNGENVAITLNQLVNTVKQQPKFADEELTIFITGLPQNTDTVRKANMKLVQAYMQRYSAQNNRQQKLQWNNNGEQDKRTSSEENSNENGNSDQVQRGDLIVINLGDVLNSFQRFALLDVEQTGNVIGDVLVQLNNKVAVPAEMIHLIGQGIAAHVAGAAARQYTRWTGQQVRRITALDPSKILAKNPNTLTGLARGDANFVDAIHTSVYGMGTHERVADVDFYPNGPAAGVPGANNVLEASMRATRYFAETVRPGNERNFPAVAASSLMDYNNKNGHGKRAYMGIDAEYDLQGDYVLQVNAQSPFGKKARATKQSTYHGSHAAQIKSWEQ